MGAWVRGCWVLGAGCWVLVRGDVRRRADPGFRAASASARSGGAGALTLVLASSHRSLSQFWERDGLPRALRLFVCGPFQRGRRRGVGAEQRCRRVTSPGTGEVVGSQAHRWGRRAAEALHRPIRNDLPGDRALGTGHFDPLHSRTLALKTEEGRLAWSRPSSRSMSSGRPSRGPAPARLEARLGGRGGSGRRFPFSAPCGSSAAGAVLPVLRSIPARPLRGGRWPGSWFRRGPIRVRWTRPAPLAPTTRAKAWAGPAGHSRGISPMRHPK